MILEDHRIPRGGTSEPGSFVSKIYLHSSATYNEVKDCETRRRFGFVTLTIARQQNVLSTARGECLEIYVLLYMILRRGKRRIGQRTNTAQ